MSFKSLNNTCRIVQIHLLQFHSVCNKLVEWKD